MIGKSDGWDSTFAERLARLEAGHFWFRSRNRLIGWALDKYFPRAGSFLEIGCGSGYVLAGIGTDRPGLQLVGSDVFTEGLPFAQERAPRATLLQMDALHMPFDREFDVIGAFDVVEHIEDDVAALREVHRSLRPGGGCLLTVPLHPRLWSVTDEFAHHKRRYTRRELAHKLDRAGFEVLRVTGFMSLVLPLLVASRLRLPASAEDFDPESEFRIHPLVNSALEGLLTAERAVIRAGASFPVGGSALAVARRRPTA